MQSQMQQAHKVQHTHKCGAAVLRGDRYIAERFQQECALKTYGYAYHGHHIPGPGAVEQTKVFLKLTSHIEF